MDAKDCQSASSKSFRNTLRGGRGAPALCFWSWKALDALLYPNGVGIGEGARTLARRIGLVKGPEIVRAVRLYGSTMRLKVSLTDLATARADWVWMDYPRDSFG